MWQGFTNLNEFTVSIVIFSQSMYGGSSGLETRQVEFQHLGPKKKTQLYRQTFKG